ncbi:MAG: Bug family tripartite tricarboxylate transporter substrate binding protein [Xanthobacteraceae bacterium]
MRRGAFLAVLVSVAAGSPLTAHAQSCPNRSVRVVVGFAAGGAVDTLARLISAKVSEGLGQPVIVDNRPGAAGNLGTDAVAKSPPDGYTVLQTTNGHAISPALYNKLPYDAVRDFAPITQLVATNLVLVTNPKLPATTLTELITLAKAKPGTLNYGSTGVGNPLHLTMEMLKRTTGMDIVVIPYKGDAPLNTALLGGEIQLAIVPLSTSIAHVEAGTLRALAVTGDIDCRAACFNVPFERSAFDALNLRQHFLLQGWVLADRSHLIGRLGPRGSRNKCGCSEQQTKTELDRNGTRIHGTNSGRSRKDSLWSGRRKVVRRPQSPGSSYSAACANCCARVDGALKSTGVPFGMMPVGLTRVSEK